jgi:hypothetical protein
MFLVNKSCLEKFAVAVRILLAFVTKGMTGTEDLQSLLQTSNIGLSAL